MLEVSPEPVCGVEPSPVLFADETELAQGLERFEGARLSQFWRKPAMHQLEELDRELDISYPTPRSLDIRRFGPGLCLLLQLADASQGLDIESLLPDHGVDHGSETLAQRLITGHGPSLEQRLELPWFTPLGVVLRVGIETAGERANRALGPKPGVDQEPGTVGPSGGEGADGCRRQGHGGGPAPGIVALGCVVDEEQVDVRRVVEFSGTPLSHGDDGEWDVGDKWVPLRHGRPGPGQDIAHEVVDGIREPGCGRGHLDATGKVVPGDGGEPCPEPQRNRLVGS